MSSVDGIAMADSSMTSSSVFPGRLGEGLRERELPGLNGIRAVAAFLVVFYHSGLPGISGGLGVLIFFVLSGFLITWLLLIEEERTATISMRRFYLRRILRIFPAFYVYWLVSVAMLLIRRIPIHWAQAVCSFFYVNDYYQAIFGDPNTAFSHTWSLAIEEQFYLIWPLAFLALCKNRKRMAQVLVAAICVIWLYRLVMRFGFHVWQGYVYEAFDMRADHLFIGCLLAVSLRLGLFARLWNALCSTWIPGAFTVFGLAVCSVAERYYGSGFRDSISFIVVPILSTFLIVVAIAFSRRGVWRVLEWRAIRYLGQISYSIYLYQQLTVGIGIKVTAHSSALVRSLAVMALTVIAASGSYFFVERYFLSLKARFASVPTQPAVSRH